MNRTLKLSLLGALTILACAGPKAETQPTPPPAPAPVAPPPPAPPPSTPDAEFRATKPAPLAEAPHFEAPVPKEHKLKNGLTVLINENHQVPLVVAELLIKTGMDGNPVAQPGLAEFTASMMNEGTKKRTAVELAEQEENLAALLSVFAAQDSTRLHLNCLTETLGQSLELMADVALNPAFREADIERVKKSYLTDLAQRQAVPAFIATNTANRLLYGPNNPWGQPQNGTQAAVSKLKTADLEKFHKTFFVPSNAVITVSGDVTAEQLLPLLEKRFGAWKGKAVPKKAQPPFPELSQRSIQVVDHAGTQSRVVIVHRMLTANDPDVVPMKTANNIVGGLFSSRLNLNLREDKAYSYGVFSGLNFNDRTGVFTAQGNIIAQHTPEAIAEMEKELSRFSTGEVTPDELGAAKSAYERSLPSQLETNDAVVASLGSLVLNGMPLNFYATLPQKIQAVTAADVARVAQKYVQPGSWPIVVVGPMGNQTDKLSALNLGPVQVVPVPGAPPAMASGPVHASPTPNAPVHK